MQIVSKRRAVRFVPELLAVLFMGIVAFAAHASGLSLLLFPELAALSHDVLTRPRGRWASQPWLLIVTPTVTAIFGTFITRHAPYGAVAVVVLVLLSLLSIKLLRSSIGPAISAGVLPLVLGERSWIYPVAIFTDLICLVAVLLLWRRFGPHRAEASERDLQHSRIVDAPETPTPDRFWVLALIAFVLVLGIAAQSTGLRFILFPPLVVMAYEIFGHAKVPGWMARPAVFPVACLLTATTGTMAVHCFKTTMVGVAVTTLVSIGILRAFQVHMPPALAVGLIPFVMASPPNVWYPVSVALGTIALTVCALGYTYRRTSQREREAVGAGLNP
jgi:hypothetical protein